MTKTVSGKEVALLVIPDGRQIIRMGVSASRVHANGATKILAHTHPNGILMLSDDVARGVASDTRQLAARNQYEIYLEVDPKNWTTEAAEQDSAEVHFGGHREKLSRRFRNRLESLSSCPGQLRRRGRNNRC